jgi:hypothetical protein
MALRSLFGLALFAIALPAFDPDAARAAEPAVAKPRFVAGTEPRVGGSAFFVAIERDPGAVAVTTAHAFSIEELARTHEVRFELGRAKQRASVASRLLAPPGKPFSAPGGTLRDDFVIFALDLAPRGVRTLLLCPKACNEVGQRVRIFGVPATVPHTEDDVFGRVTKVAADQLEVELDVPADLRGWGGGPVLRHPEGDVIGLLQAQWPSEDGVKIGVGPIDGVRAALAKPLEGGLGRAFAAFGAGGTSAASGAAGSAVSRGVAGAAGARSAAGAVAARGAPVALEDGTEEGPLLGRAGALSTELRLAIDYPADEAVVGDDEGAFVAGRALALLGEFRRFDVMLVLDTSDSTRAASGADVNENGVVGEDRVFGIFPTTDSGDSILAAEVAAAERVLESLDPRSTRVGLVTFAGEPLPPPGVLSVGGSGRPDALTEQALTTEYGTVKKALRHVLDRGPEGLTNMTEGLRAGVRELKGFRGGVSQPDPGSEKVVLFFTDGQPTLPYDGGAVAMNVRSVLRAADQARRANVRIHSFAIGPEALEGPVAVVEMARITEGRFTPVRKPGDLVEVIENVDFANLESLAVRNQTLDRDATELVQKADGGFGALVPLAKGRNVLEVAARATDGSEARAQVVVHHLPGAAPAQAPRELVALRNQLLEKRVLNLRRGRVEAERTRNEEVRRGIELEIERERATAEQRAQQQRRELRIDPEREAEGGGKEAQPAEEPDSP